MSVRLQELILGFGKGKQADIATANTAPNVWRMNKTNRQIHNAQPVNEDDAEELGKGHEFATTQYKSHIEPAGITIEKYNSAEIAAWTWAFGLGKVAKTGTEAPFTYTCTAQDPVTDGIELPYTSYIEQVRPGASVVHDQMFVGCAVRSFRFRITKGPGRVNSTVTVDLIHSGKVTTPSAITLPAATAENLLNAYSLACTINGVDYIGAKTFESLEMGIDNEFIDGHYPGSGMDDDDYQIQGRLEVARRVPVFNFVARYKAGSLELAKVRALTDGTAVVNLTKDSGNSMVVTWQKVGFQTAVLGESDGLITVQVTGKPMYHATNGLVTAVCKCGVDGICEAPA